jgi:hypothetical protein
MPPIYMHGRLVIVGRPAGEDVVHEDGSGGKVREDMLSTVGL